MVNILLYYHSQGNESVYKSVTAKAIEPSQVIRLPMNALKDIFDENPDILVRVVQVIMIRLQRVIFTALRNYLGLYSELVQSKPHKDKRTAQSQTQAQSTGSTATSAPISIPSAGSSSMHPPKSSPTQVHFRRNTYDTIHTLEAQESKPELLNDLTEATWVKPSRRISVLVEKETDYSTLQAYAIEGFLKELGLKDSDRILLEGNIDFQEAEPGVTLLREGNPNVCTINIYVINIS